MLDNNLIQSTSSWPFVEIRKLLKDRKDIIKKKNKISSLKIDLTSLEISEYKKNNLQEFDSNSKSLKLNPDEFLSPNGKLAA